MQEKAKGSLWPRCGTGVIFVNNEVGETNERLTKQGLAGQVKGFGFILCARKPAGCFKHSTGMA